MTSTSHRQRRARYMSISHIVKPVTGPSFLQKVLAQVIGHERSCKVCNITSHMFGWASLLGTVFILVLAAVMFTRPQPTYTMPTKDYEIPKYEYSNGMAITVPPKLDTKVQSAKYEFSLEDSRGNVLYVWPVQVDSGGKPIFDAVDLILPSNLRLDIGNYYIHASVDYRHNPLSRHHMEGNVARVIVKDQSTQ